MGYLVANYSPSGSCPPEFAQVTQFHEAIDQSPTVSKELLVVYLANLLAKRAGYGQYNEKQDDTRVEHGAKSIGLDITGTQEVLNELNVFMEETGLSFD